MTFPVLQVLDAQGYIASIGQLDYEAEKTLRRLIREGRVEKVRAPWAGTFAIKTHFVADRARFDAAQVASADKFALAAAMDSFNRTTRKAA